MKSGSLFKATVLSTALILATTVSTTSHAGFLSNVASLFGRSAAVGAGLGFGLGLFGFGGGSGGCGGSCGGGHSHHHHRGHFSPYMNPYEMNIYGINSFYQSQLSGMYGMGGMGMGGMQGMYGMGGMQGMYGMGGMQGMYGMGGMQGMYGMGGMQGMYGMGGMQGMYPPYGGGGWGQQQQQWPSLPIQPPQPVNYYANQGINSPFAQGTTNGSLLNSNANGVGINGAGTIVSGSTSGTVLGHRR